jgi:hypothetical protein
VYAAGVGVVLAAPFTTETPETPAKGPDADASHPFAVWVLPVVPTLCELWQSAHSLCRLLKPPNSFSCDLVWFGEAVVAAAS